jgi:ABC-type antimicrobial peptide transport system permease subunit
VIPVFHLQPMSTYLALSVSRQRFALGLVAALGTLALGLAAIGVFGVMSFLVRSRSRELGVRMAVGASPADIRRLVSGQLLRCLAGGVVIGLGVAAVEARTLAALVFGIGVFDLSTIAIVTAVLVATVALSAAVPVHRSTRIDPVITLRTD